MTSALFNASFLIKLKHIIQMRLEPQCFTVSHNFRTDVMKVAQIRIDTSSIMQFFVIIKNLNTRQYKIKNIVYYTMSNTILFLVTRESLGSSHKPRYLIPSTTAEESRPCILPRDPDVEM